MCNQTNSWKSNLSVQIRNPLVVGIRRKRGKIWVIRSMKENMDRNGNIWYYFGKERSGSEMQMPGNEAFFGRISVKQGIYETIKDWIIERRLKPGERIYDTELASYFHVSRTPVREALQLLETQKLVKTYPGKATMVTELETRNIEKWYQPMAILQQLAVNLEADNIKHSQLEQLRLAREM